ncbi:hypothetical protein BpHYR1_002141 [Brachionus plicatilis]|uniref:Uncharacterized protein n=1 Tax=Brachionus plicatilis TaxID=10195 RepID=A0A3M7P3B4_BRAPC|nr:hypothetical protein BpHYR1_002141 [Brachionus plicatilis]
MVLMIYNFKINFVNAEWCNIHSCINCKSLLVIEMASLHGFLMRHFRPIFYLIGYEKNEFQDKLNY